jgi:hypothetical protein
MTLARGRFGYRSRALRRSTVEVVHGANVTVTLQCGSPVAKTVTPIAPVSGGRPRKSIRPVPSARLIPDYGLP